jgi:hypothetical protein
MIGFIAANTSTARGYRQYRVIADLHTFQFTVTHAEVRFPAQEREFSLFHSVRTSSVAHPVSYEIGHLR